MKKNIIYNSIFVFLSALMLISLLNSIYFFLFLAKLSILKWLTFNACSLAILIYFICYAFYYKSKKEKYLSMALIPLYYYGTMGLFIMTWTAANTFAHLTHIVITLNIIWLLFKILNTKNYDQIGKGLLIGISIFFPLFAFIQIYSQKYVQEILSIISNIKF